MTTQQQFQYTSDWWTRHTNRWQRVIRPLLPSRSIHALEVGSYEGRSAIWIAENLLDAEESFIICVDVWNNLPVEERFDMNVAASGLSSRIQKRKGDAYAVLCHVGETFDLIYLDADHVAHSVLTQSCLVWPKLKVGGVLVWDDYAIPDSRVSHHKGRHPCTGIDAFLTCWEGKFALLWKEYQVAIVKLSH